MNHGFGHHCVRLPLKPGPKDPEKSKRAPRCFPVNWALSLNNEGLLRGRSQLRAAARGAGPEAADGWLLLPDGHRAQYGRAQRGKSAGCSTQQMWHACAARRKQNLLAQDSRRARGGGA